MEKNTQKKSGFIVLVGRLSVRKPILMSHLIGQEVAITFDKPQITRNRIQTVYTDERRQIIFLDTPGIHKAKSKLGEYIVNVTGHTLEDMDVVPWLVKPTTPIGAEERHIAKRLNKTRTPVILVISKISTVKQQDGVFTLIVTYKDMCRFTKIVPLSALKDKNTDLLTELIFKYLSYDPQFYDEDTMTDQPMRQIASELIREKALCLLNDKIPHGITVTIGKMRERPNSIIDTGASTVCERDSHKGVVIGKGGSMLRRIGTETRKDIEHIVDMQVSLQLWVRIREE